MIYLCKISYIGTDFHGFQVQPSKRTVQGELMKAFESAFKTTVTVTGCSRTDAGVHATSFCLTVQTENEGIPASKLPVAVLPFLPLDISVYEAKEVSSDFHPRYDVQSKEYTYQIVNRKIPDPFLYRRVWFLPRPIGNEGFERMQDACKHLLGKHDFSGFMAEGSDVSDTEREVYSCFFQKENDILTFKIRADGFLYNMVRIIVGTLVDIGYGRLSSSDLDQMLLSHNRQLGGPTAPADGLYLSDVVYKK